MASIALVKAATFAGFFFFKQSFIGILAFSVDKFFSLYYWLLLKVTSTVTLHTIWKLQLLLVSNGDINQIGP